MEIAPELRKELEAELDMIAKDVEIEKFGAYGELLKRNNIFSIGFRAMSFYLIGACRLIRKKGGQHSIEGQAVCDIVLSNGFLNDRIIARLTPVLERLKAEDEVAYREALGYIEGLPKRISPDFLFLEADILGLPEPPHKGKTKKTRELVADTTKISSTIFNPSVDIYESNLEFTTAERRKVPIKALVTVNYEEMRTKGVDIPAWDRLKPFDREVLSAATSLYKVGNNIMTPQMIYQALTGNKAKTNLPPVMRERIIKSLKTLRGVQITIDAEAEFKANLNKKGRYEGALLPSERIEAELNGQLVIDAIHILRSSPLYDYAEGKGQISRIDINMLNAPVNNTEQNIELKGYLARHIESAKNPHSKIGPTIRYDTLYSYLRIEEGIPEENKQGLKDKKQDIRKAVRAILDYWTKEGEIEGYEEEKEGGKIAKINLKLKSNKVKK